MPFDNVTSPLFIGDTEMTDIERHLAEMACSRLILQYAEAVDRYDHDTVMSLYCSDATYYAPTGTLRGKNELRRYFDAKSRTPRGLHIYTNILIDVLDQHNATGTSAVSFYFDATPPTAGPSPMTPPSVLTRVYDRFRVEQGAWRFSERRVQVLFGAPVK
jgi:hypothetical protein